MKLQWINTLHSMSYKRTFMEGHSSSFTTVITHAFVLSIADLYLQTCSSTVVNGNTFFNASHLSTGDGQCHKYSHPVIIKFRDLLVTKFTMPRLSHVLAVETSLVQNLRP
jgi:protein involved in ribonucleotide reduction